MTIHAFQTDPYYLAGAGAVIGDTTLTLKSMKDIDGNTITMSVFGSIGYFTLEPGNNTLEEQGSFTGLTNNVNGTTTLTGIKSVTFATPYTETAGLLKTHAGSSILVISNTSGYENQYPAKQNDEIITGQWTFTNTPIVPGVVSDASTTVKGVTKVSVAPVLSSNPVSVGDNDPRVPTQNENDALVGTGTPSSTDKYVNQSTLTGYVATTGVYQSDTDQTQSTSNSTYAVGEGNVTTKHASIAEKFVPTTTGIRGVKLWKIADTGSFTGSIKVSLQADVASNPSGTDLASFTITNTAWLKLNSAAEFGIQFTTPYTAMTIGSSYWIVVVPSTTDTSNHPNLGANTAGGYASGALKFNNGTDGWTLTPTTILYFKTTQITINKVIESSAISGIPSPVMQGYAFLTNGSTSITISNSTVNTNVSTTVASIQLEGGQIGINSGLRITTLNSQSVRYGNNSGDAAGIVIRYNGTDIINGKSTGEAASQEGYSGLLNTYYILNQGSYSSQISKAFGLGTITSGSSLSTMYTNIATSVVDFSQPGLLEIIGQCTVSSTSGTVIQTVVFKSYVIEKIT